MPLEAGQGIGRVAVTCVGGKGGVCVSAFAFDQGSTSPAIYSATGKTVRKWLAYTGTPGEEKQKGCGESHPHDQRISFAPLVARHRSQRYDVKGATQPDFGPSEKQDWTYAVVVTISCIHPGLSFISESQLLVLKD